MRDLPFRKWYQVRSKFSLSVTPFLIYNDSHVKFFHTVVRLKRAVDRNVAFSVALVYGDIFACEIADRVDRLILNTQGHQISLEKLTAGVAVGNKSDIRRAEDTGDRP